MTPPPDDGAVRRMLSFWRRTVRGPSLGARIAIYDELAPTVGAGIGVREALHATAARHGGAKRHAVELLAEGLARDVPLSETMRANPDHFTPMESAVVSTGERSGRLDVAFRGASAQLDRAKNVRDRMLQAVAYPLVLVHCFILMCAIVASFQGRSFLAIALPSFVLFWGVVLGSVSAHAALRDRRGYARALHRLPVVGRVVRAGALARFARAFGALHGAGVPYGEALRVAADAGGDAELRAQTAVAVHALDRGATLPEALAVIDELPSEDRGLLVAGEHSGELESAAHRVATLEDERFDVAVKRASSVLPGVLVVIMGALVGFYAISFYANLYKGF
jgi:type II secretory pathway component PulF